MLTLSQVLTPNQTISTEHLISSIPLTHLHNLIPSLPSLSPSRTSVGVINLVFPLPSTQIHPPGFGYLIPRCLPTQNPEGVLGVIFDSTALPMDEDPELTKLTVMMGGPWWSSYRDSSGSSLTRPSSPEDLVGPALVHLRTTFPVLKGVEPILVILRLHADCIPTYTPGHGARMRELHEHLEGGEWKGKLSLVGNGYGGVGVNDCVFSAEEVVRGLIENRSVTGLERWSDWK